MYSIFVLQLFMFFGIVITTLPSLQLNSLNINSFMWTTMLCFYSSGPSYLSVEKSPVQKR